jgi:hypothetical protein
VARASEQFRQSDVALWGIVALICGAFAVLSANISVLVPDGVLAGLHTSRLAGADISDLRAQIANLEADTNRAERENAQLRTQFSLSEENASDVTRRVGALELSIPRMLEAMATQAAEAVAAVDRSAITSSISEPNTLSFEADGGSVSVTQTPMLADETAEPEPQPMPELIADVPAGPVADKKAYGVALGPTVKLADAEAAWDDLSVKLGPLLFGLGPLLADQPETVEKRLVIGPLNDLAEATALCTRLERVSIPCLPVPFVGEPILLN